MPFSAMSLMLYLASKPARLTCFRFLVVVRQDLGLELPTYHQPSAPLIREEIFDMFLNSSTTQTHNSFYGENRSGA
ncbi:hypothetical protein GGR52DRAFT_523502 [Hypoxylon sp. FL1284]|nr:hypothetical protein GGR52DRAFT_523502 [Hypoxylon sp. FL1284]